MLDQVRERIRDLHYSLQTEKAYVYRANAFALWTARRRGGFRHPRDMGQAEVEGFLMMLATEKHVSTTMIYTHVLKVAAGGTASPLDTIALAN